MRNKKVILSSILSLVLCLSLIVGGTFALFTHQTETNIAITSGKVEVVATIENLAVYSPTAIAEDGTITNDTNAAADGVFANGGTATIEGADLKLDKMTPGDKVTFDIRIKNNSTVAVKYRTLLTVSENDGLFSGLNVTVDGTPFGNTLQSAWASLAVDSEDIIVPVEVVLPSTAGNDYQEKSAKLSFTVSAVQGNTETVDIDPDVDMLLAEGAATVNIPAGTLTAGEIVKLKVASTEAPATVVTIDDTLLGATDISFVDADGNPVTMPNANYTVTMDIGKGLDATKLAIYHNKEKVEPITYNAGTGIVTFTTTSFSPFTAVLEGVGTIDSAEKLTALRDSIEAGENKEGVVFYLTKDIDLGGVEWESIGEISAPPYVSFAGTLDGQGHTISNFGGQGLFDLLTATSVIQNLNIKNVNSTTTNFAALAAQTSGKVINCTVDGVNVQLSSYANNVAGFIGKVNAGAEVTNCKVFNVTIEWADDVTNCSDVVAGVISSVAADATVKGCEFKNINVIASGRLKRTAGIFSSVSGNVSDCKIEDVTLKGGQVIKVGGIIAMAGATANIDNVTVDGLVMECNGTFSEFGGFIGQLDTRTNATRATINNCHIVGLNMTVSGKGESWASASAGFISGLNGAADITNCSVAGEIDATANGGYAVAGFVGDAGSATYKVDNVVTAIVTNISGCVADVDITVADSVAGAFVARAGRVTGANDAQNYFNFTNCEANGTVAVTGTGTAGDFYGAKFGEVNTFTGCKVNGEDFNG